jgi:hypothetical protein
MHRESRSKFLTHMNIVSVWIWQWTMQLHFKLIFETFTWSCIHTIILVGLHSFSSHTINVVIWIDELEYIVEYGFQWKKKGKIVSLGCFPPIKHRPFFLVKEKIYFLFLCFCHILHGDCVNWARLMKFLCDHLWP